MIYSLTGKVSTLDDNTIVIDTGNMAFEVICSSYTVFALSGKTEPQTILTYLQVREDAMCLFGFKDNKEKKLFNDLLLVSGVGPKMAITVLSGLSTDDIIRAILSSDIKTLSSIKGLGKKTAERIILELSKKLGGESSLDSLVSEQAEVQTKLKKEIEEAYEVLVSTGMQKAEAMELAKTNYKDGITSEELVVLCFKNARK
ncbi:MAG: Holliday junction branch migration protein RuvA [Clostridia bacterium]|nr:Holliday junction branch migration protein RuvA [Clostridia bacterium]